MHTSKIRRDKLTIAAPQKVPSPSGERREQQLDTKTLFKGARELKIQHNSETYRLTITKLGKLILTK
ncbi:MAG: hemin uptake protein HemP [Roseobacter sp.]|uniref:hemin uptake protein HemP n=1 Tax=Roseibium sp. TaxID=1936156 RepID=UPI0032669A67